LELESDTKHVAQARICTVISLPRQNDAQAVSSPMRDDMVTTAQEGDWWARWRLITVDYIGWSWKVSLNMLHKPEFVPLYRCLARVTPMQAVSSSATGDMVFTAQEAVWWARLGLRLITVLCQRRQEVDRSVTLRNVITACPYYLSLSVQSLPQFTKLSADHRPRDLSTILSFRHLHSILQSSNLVTNQRLVALSLSLLQVTFLLTMNFKIKCIWMYENMHFYVKNATIFWEGEIPKF